ncbi:hypothetical protein C8Q80DRAFT_1269978 [Daedaleopsis nitida]|nr:hypothetical protein C8Q80DRAFT_1269978 [Daedaleopsis nitida]
MERDKIATVVSLGEYGTMIFIVLRPGVDSQSWISFNGFPPTRSSLRGIALEWQGPIRVPGYGIEQCKWTIRMIGMEVYDLESLPEGDDVDYRLKQTLRAKLDLKDAPIDVILDTGASVSLVPSEVIQRVRTGVFATPENARVHTERGNDAASIHHMKPDYTGNTTRVTLPVDPFLCTKATWVIAPEEYEGLLFTDPRKPVPGQQFRTCIFGTNFFNASIVSLVDPCQRGRHPEVFIAMQLPGVHTDIQPPPLLQ